MFHNRGRFNTYRKRRRQGKQKRKGNDIGPSYNYKKPGHLIADCPEMKNKVSPSKKTFKKKAMKVIQDDSESDFEEDVDSTNGCFMVQEETSSKVTSEPTLENSKLTLDELGFNFQELYEKYISLKF